MVIELDAITMEDYKKIRNDDVISEPVQNYGTMQVIIFISLSLIGIILVLCIARRFYLQDEYELDLERIPSVTTLSSQEKLS
uniref:APP_amyloid domain-containing protein n=1 Tax=Caenorhabditis tropicalis TaxID=1561998 RepID=A0A1I7UAM2_9PELO